jgi:SAM-dependent methyltransferase
MLRHAQALARQMTASRRLSGNSLVIEAASNDGYLLQYYREADVPVLGVEPAQNVAKVARSRRRIPTVVDFFGEELARRLRSDGRRADVFHAHNVLAHVPDLGGFVRGIREVLKDDGVAVIEVPYVRDLVDQCEFDTIYHEHLSYFSLTSLDHLFARHGLRIQDALRIPIHGGSIRLMVGKEPGPEPSTRVAALLSEEADAGLDRIDYYRDFAAQVTKLKTELRGLLTKLRKDGKRLAAYGASAKGSTLLNCFGIGRDLLDFVVDRSTVKQGRYTPGSRLPIHAPETLLERMPDHVLLLTWNFADEILEQQAEYRRRGGKFIQFVPRLKVA